MLYLPALALTHEAWVNAGWYDSLNIATAVRRHPDARIILLDRLYHPSSASFASPEALAALDRLGIPSAILSA